MISCALGANCPPPAKTQTAGIHFFALLMREAVGFQANHSHSIENAVLHSQNTFESDRLDIKIQALDEYRRLWYNIAIVLWACLSEERIRHICRDSHGNIWFSGYGAHGLVRIALYIFIPKNQKTLTISGRKRLSEGAFGGMGEGVLFSGTSRKQKASFIL